MKAAVMYGQYDIRIEERAKPVPLEGEAVIKVKTAGICGSDIHFYDGSHPYKNYPRVYGHELAGIIDEISGNNKGLKKGDKVVIEPLIPCGRCYPCRIGKYNCCANAKMTGVHVDGGFAEYILVPINNIYKIPDSMPFNTACLCEPYSIGAQIVVIRAEVKRDDKVVILGSGAIGLCALDFIKNIGARVLITDIQPFRLEMAKLFGADVVINSKEENINDCVMNFTDSEGASVVIEATGVAKIMENTENLVAAGGRIVIAGLTNDKVAFTGINFTKKEMTILGSRNSMNMFPYVVDMMSSGKLNAKKLITHKFTFDKIMEAFEFISKNPGKIGKVIIEMG